MTTVLLILILIALAVVGYVLWVRSQRKGGVIASKPSEQQPPARDNQP